MQKCIHYIQYICIHCGFLGVQCLPVANTFSASLFLNTGTMFSVFCFIELHVDIQIFATERIL